MRHQRGISEYLHLAEHIKTYKVTIPDNQTSYIQALTTPVLAEKSYVYPLGLAANEGSSIAGNEDITAVYFSDDSGNRVTSGLASYVTVRTYSTHSEGNDRLHAFQVVRWKNFACKRVIHGMKTMGDGVSNFNTVTQILPVANIGSMPTFVAAGTAVATGSGSGFTTAVLPAGIQKDDILVILIETDNQNITDPGGWTRFINNGVGTPGDGTATRIIGLWKRATGSDSNATISINHNHMLVRVFAFRGCHTGVNPFGSTLATSTLSSADTAVSIDGGTTNYDNCLVVNIVSNATDTNTEQGSGWTNGDLSDITEISDINTSQGDGGGFTVITGGKATAGAFGATTGTLASSSKQSRVTFTLAPKRDSVRQGYTAPIYCGSNAAYTNQHQSVFMGKVSVDSSGDFVTITRNANDTNIVDFYYSVIEWYPAVIVRRQQVTISFPGGSTINETTAAIIAVDVDDTMLYWGGCNHNAFQDTHMSCELTDEDTLTLKNGTAQNNSTRNAVVTVIQFRKKFIHSRQFFDLLVTSPADYSDTAMTDIVDSEKTLIHTCGNRTTNNFSNYYLGAYVEPTSNTNLRLDRSANGFGSLTTNVPTTVLRLKK